MLKFVGLISCLISVCSFAQEKANILKYRRETKSPLTAAMWALAPGGGQFYNGDIAKGILFAGAGLISIICITHKEVEKYPDPQEETIYPAYKEENTYPLRAAGIMGLITVLAGGAADAYFSAIQRDKELRKKYGIKVGYNNKAGIEIVLFNSFGHR